jgi:hypothetical protein
MTPEIAERHGVEPCVLVTLSGSRPRRSPDGRVRVLADVGLRAAASGASVAEYIALIRRHRATWAIVPDAFGDFRETLRLWHRYAPAIARHAAPVLALQGFHRWRPVLHALDMGIRRVALPMRRHPDASCSMEPRLCAERAARALGVLCGAVDHVHLLGPALRSLRLLLPRLKDCEGQGTTVSFDTIAYHRAPDAETKRALGGRWQPRSSGEALMLLDAWLRLAGL